MSKADATTVAAGNERPRRDGGSRAALIAAYREGLALSAVQVIAGSARVRAVATNGHESVLDPDESVVAQWWCRRTAEAECLAASVARSRRRNEENISEEIRLACETVVRAARRQGIPLRSNDEIVEEAMRIVIRLDDEIKQQQQAGHLKSVNKTYRQYRLDASARGDRVMRYAEWMERYKEKLVREIAANLR